MLPKVSRTFAPTIRMLPAGLNTIVTVAYLLCRIAGDDVQLPIIVRRFLLLLRLDQLQTNLQGFMRIVIGNGYEIGHVFSLF